MGGAALGAPGKQIKEGEEGGSGTTTDEPDEELRGPPPQPEGLSAKGFHTASARLDDVPASPCALFLV